MSVIRPLQGLGVLSDMKRDLPLYLVAAAQAPVLDKQDVDGYTQSLLQWWRTNGSQVASWALAARIAFAISPNSASCERVFLLLENMYGELQDRALADQLRAALMLRYNERRVG
jgi:hypothetical protein